MTRILRRPRQPVYSTGAMPPYSLRYEEIRNLLGRTRPVLCPDGNRKPAAVALILRQGPLGLELLFIQRALHPNDPWSGNIGFPGGGVEPQDASLRHTAERETMEEVGLDLTSALFLGQLSDIVGSNLPVRVSCFVYGLHETPPPVLSSEIREAFWVSFAHLTTEQYQIIQPVSFEGRTFQVPAIHLHSDKPVLWGITYRLVSQFRYLLLSDTAPPTGHDFPR